VAITAEKETPKEKKEKEKKKKLLWMVDG